MKNLFTEFELEEGKEIEIATPDELMEILTKSWNLDL